MPGTAGPPPPEDRPETEADETPSPPYPGWSTQQPERRGWGDPGGWQQPGGAQSPGAPPPSGGAQTPGGSPPAGGWQQPGGSPSGLPGGAPASGGWTAAPGPAWQVPDAKPGVIPLRPLGVGEILDGAVTTIRRNLGAMLGLSALVAAVTQLLSTASLVWMFGEQVTEPAFGLTDDVEQIDNVATGIPAALLSSFITLIATVFLTGVLTVVVGQAVLGRRLSAAQAWRESKGRLLRLLGLTLLYTVIWVGPLIACLVLAVVLASVGAGAVVLIVVGGIIVAAVVGVWLYVRFALAVPAFMLETAPGPDGRARPLRVIPALRRSSALVRGSWWRTFAILLLITFIVWLIGQVVAVPLGVPGLFSGADSGGSVVTWFILNTLAGIIAATISAPFSAAATALLYVDRRIRREGLDIELARAAGVDLPGYRGPGGPPRSS